MPAVKSMPMSKRTVSQTVWHVYHAVQQQAQRWPSTAPSSPSTEQMLACKAHLFIALLGLPSAAAAVGATTGVHRAARPDSSQPSLLLALGPACMVVPKNSQAAAAVGATLGAHRAARPDSPQPSLLVPACISKKKPVNQQQQEQEPLYMHRAARPNSSQPSLSLALGPARMVVPKNIQAVKAVGSCIPTNARTAPSTDSLQPPLSLLQYLQMWFLTLNQQADMKYTELRTIKKHHQ